MHISFSDCEQRILFKLSPQQASGLYPNQFHNPRQAPRHFTNRVTPDPRVRLAGTRIFNELSPSAELATLPELPTGGLLQATGMRRITLALLAASTLSGCSPDAPQPPPQAIPPGTSAKKPLNATEQKASPISIAPQQQPTPPTVHAPAIKKEETVKQPTAPAVKATPEVELPPYDASAYIEELPDEIPAGANLAADFDKLQEATKRRMPPEESLQHAERCVRLFYRALEHGDLTTAEHSYNTATALFKGVKKSPPVVRRKHRQKLEALGTTMQKLEQSFDVLQKIKELPQDNPAAHDTWGTFYREQGNFLQAVHHFARGEDPEKLFITDSTSVDGLLQQAKAWHGKIVEWNQPATNRCVQLLMAAYHHPQCPKEQRQHIQKQITQLGFSIDDPAPPLSHIPSPTLTPLEDGQTVTISHIDLKKHTLQGGFKAANDRTSSDQGTTFTSTAEASMLRVAELPRQWQSYSVEFDVNPTKNTPVCVSLPLGGRRATTLVIDRNNTTFIHENARFNPDKVLSGNLLEEGQVNHVKVEVLQTGTGITLRFFVGDKSMGKFGNPQTYTVDSTLLQPTPGMPEFRSIQDIAIYVESTGTTISNIAIGQNTVPR